MAGQSLFILALEKVQFADVTACGLQNVKVWCIRSFRSVQRSFQHYFGCIHVSYRKRVDCGVVQ
jgi:hypothetical protein